MRTFLLILFFSGICFGANAYQIVTSSDSTQIGKIVSHREVPPILTIGDNGILIGEDKTYTLVVRPKDVAKDEDYTLTVILVFVVLIVAGFVLAKKND